MARESRHLIIFGVPESAEEEGIKEVFERYFSSCPSWFLIFLSHKLRNIFCRYGPVEKVKILPSGEEGEERSALVDFMDIKSAISAHDSGTRVAGEEVRAEYSETTLASLNRSRRKWQDRRSDL